MVKNAETAEEFLNLCVYDEACRVYECSHQWTCVWSNCKHYKSKFTGKFVAWQTKGECGLCRDNRCTSRNAIRDVKIARAIEKL